MEGEGEGVLNLLGGRRWEGGLGRSLVRLLRLIVLGTTYRNREIENQSHHSLGHRKLVVTMHSATPGSEPCRPMKGALIRGGGIISGVHCKEKSRRFGIHKSELSMHGTSEGV